MNSKVIKILKNGGVGILLTDTLYGLVGQALDERAVARIYEIKNRDRNKPSIILISSIEDLKLFGIKTGSKLKECLEKYWPGPVSVILPCRSKRFEYLHRGTKSLAFRIPKKNVLLKILKETGPLIAPSANPENLPSAKNIEEAKKYFNGNVDFYLKGTKAKNKPSRVIRVLDESIEVVRN